MTRRLFVLAMLVSAAISMVPTPAQAGLLPVQVSVLPESGNYRWTYAIVLPTDSQLQSGDYFTIYDFGGMVNGSAAAPNGSTIHVANVRAPPKYLNPTHNPHLP